MEKEGLDTRKIIKTVDNLFSANQALNFYKKKSLYTDMHPLCIKKQMFNK